MACSTLSGQRALPAVTGDPFQSRTGRANLYDLLFIAKRKHLVNTYHALPCVHWRWFWRVFPRLVAQPEHVCLAQARSRWEVLHGDVAELLVWKNVKDHKLEDSLVGVATAENI